MIIDKIKEAVVQMDENTVKEMVYLALKKNYAPNEILERGLVAGMKEVGRLFSCQKYFVPEVLLASESFYAGFNIISPLLKKQTTQSKGKIVIGVVEGDIHDIGKNIVKVMLEASGYKVIDLGHNISVEKFISAVKRERPAVLALSSLMTTTMMQMEKVIKELENENLRECVKVIVGGAPLNQNFADYIHADGYGQDAAEAVLLVEKLIRG
ncbi:MAG: corrinoid protein [candidate division WOR-3 bacterium]|nr:corrinoid protein [candidate division WOR-3 bacterium]